MKASAILSLGLFLVICVGLTQIGCRGPQGPAGPPGEGFTGLEGFAAGIKCADCHSSDQDTLYNVRGRTYQWERSRHAIGGQFERNAALCSGCHTTEGFMQRMRGQTVTSQLNPSPPGCFACHSPHARGDFSLRTRDIVTLKSNVVGVSDFQFDYGKGNLCAQCHMPRTMTPAMNANAPGDSIVIRTSRWHQHYGVQSLMLMGVGGFHFPGYTYRGNSYHTTSTTIRQEGCITCHMAEPTAGTGVAGAHTMNLRYTFGGVERSLLTGCNQSGCHTPPLTTIDYRGIQTAVRANLDTLYRLLGARGWIDTVSTSPTYGLVRLVGGQLVISPAVKAGALYNYFTVKYDRSDGGHNSLYAIDLLRSSIEELRR